MVTTPENLPTGADGKPLVSVIIPVYNAQRYLRACIDSILNQTHQPYEIILINDGSTDRSGFIISDYVSAHPDIIKTEYQHNQGQGVARNRGLSLARGKYVLFVDSDDFIDPRTVEITTARAEAAGADIVKFDWEYYYASKGRIYNNVEPYASKASLDGAECEELLTTNHYFSVTALYSRDFLLRNNIRYGERYIYEDVVFFAASALQAERVEIITAPLYSVRPHGASTTKTDYDTRKHMDGFLRAFKESSQLLAEKHRNPYSAFYLYAYIMRKYFVYYRNRVHPKHRRELRASILKIMQTCDLNIPEDSRADFLRYIKRKNVIKNERQFIFYLLTTYKSQFQNYAFRIKRKTRNIARRWRRRARISRAPQPSLNSGKTRDDYFHALARPEAIAYYRQHSLKRTVRHGLILFTGYDHKYAGNSRYLFQELINDQRFEGCDIRFVSSESLPRGSRIEPWSREHMDALATASIMITESWLPEFIGKRAASLWVQLWHGTPLKRVLFDSAENQIVTRRRRHKIMKYRDTNRWDLVIADSHWGERRMGSGFLVPPEKLLLTGYPRVRWLRNNINNIEKIESIKSSLGFTPDMLDKKVILYAPTWRDYNYGQAPEAFDLSYAEQLFDALKHLEDEYIILVKDHAYMQSVAPAGASIIRADEIETQEALLVSDHLISDYSSIIFDALAVDMPVTLFAPDLSAYEEARGVYPEIWRALHNLVYTDGNALLKRITDPAATNGIDNAWRYLYAERENLSDHLARVVAATGIAEAITAGEERPLK